LRAGPGAGCLRLPLRYEGTLVGIEFDGGEGGKEGRDHRGIHGIGWDILTYRHAVLLAEVVL
ncbi:MAG TPA: hypothetical protein VGX03_09730, partial [Candidatus Binatia bacterium]|nr:hypothetical protein [Candidatus Binatia bacterium]